MTPHNFELVATELGAVKVLRSRVFGDDRGHFYESWREEAFAALGVEARFVQDNQSVSRRGVLRGLHWQAGRHPQGKLVRCVRGRVFDAVVDIRAGSPTFGRHFATALGGTGESVTLLWIPPGFAHGLLSLEEESVVEYKCTAPWSKADEGCLRWDDPDLKIAWPIAGRPILSARDAAGMTFAEYRRNPAFGGKA